MEVTVDFTESTPDGVEHSFSLQQGVSGILEERNIVLDSIREHTESGWSSQCTAYKTMLLKHFFPYFFFSASR